MKQNAPTCSLACLLILLPLLALIVTVGSFVDGDFDVKRSDFPDGFLFGTATSAYQIEGAYREDGRGPSNWDSFCGIEGNVPKEDNGYVAEDHYHRYMEDIELMHSLGVNAYRFSISWSRLLPKGKLGEVNPAAIIFYNKIIDNILLRGIEPFVTIHHSDYPQELEDRYGGWLSPLMLEDFVYFAKICYMNFADRVKYWTTINEPNLVADLGYARGLYPPARCSLPYGNCTKGNSDVEPLTVVHNMLLAHAKASKLYRDQFKVETNGMIGIVVTAFMYIPLTEDKEDKKAANRALAFNVAWILDPVVFGDYPSEMRRYHGNELPKFLAEERVLLRDSIDFIGINHYSTLYAKDCLHSSCICNDFSCTKGYDRPLRGFVFTAGVKNGILIGEPTGMISFYVVPKGMEDIVSYVKKRYHNKAMFVTENGYSSPDNEDETYQHDVNRINFHKSYLSYLAKAIRKGADVRGYFIWTLKDDFEWFCSYSPKFGLFRIDHPTFDRIPKLSAVWYRDFLIRNSSFNFTDVGLSNNAFVW